MATDGRYVLNPFPRRVGRRSELTRQAREGVAGLSEGETNDAWPARIHPDDRERVVAHYTRMAEELPLERDEQEVRRVDLLLLSPSTSAFPISPY